MKKLPRSLQKTFFTTKKAKTHGLDGHALRALVNAGVLEQPARGIYRVAGSDYDEEAQFEVATMIAGRPSAICLISALFHYGLTDVVPKKTWIMVPNEKRSRSRELKLHRTRTPDWNIGIVKHKSYSITSVERTIVEAICYRHKLGSTIGVEALRKSVQNQKITLGKVMDMAKKLGVLPRLIPYIEALAT